MHVVFLSSVYLGPVPCSAQRPAARVAQPLRVRRRPALSTTLPAGRG
ncbi:hypothetical protein SUBVAR_04197 [Subdoligranulum variabile DSM 15176]|uniref:Uncharacterized protein n=1 Tax=Subdoligranulum variabile DSM 15176 TaxID=411471 RepID=D1PIN1_9FIRM|nr:hypothetical protein SUBVAR_04197 [Subdoligranulum variabile DSM 15176]